MATIELYLVRHGQTYLNKYHRMQGWSDSPLTAQGIADADRVGQRLAKIPFAAAYASDMLRAQTTAQHILAANDTLDVADLQTAPALREENFGFFEGLDSTFTAHFVGSPVGSHSYDAMIRDLSIEKTRDLIKEHDPFHDAENDQEFWDRLQPGLDAIVAAAQDGDKVVIATHGTTIRSIVSKYSDIDVASSAKNGSVTKLTVKDGHYKVNYFNNTTGKLK
ncbi:histidine phosphatase family protein [Levilactobacillus namurensis]|uniref:histidine phosphatase family protein n=1 Tax=Levilactobacillus namurensis TaxID=380393 RepID=UPI00223152D9|nr:histidine phosphatase family protein [Levilactobacillus namurensis]MCW3777714.1 histidine phosphatase family protein [Levilactobacillus namurensis]MDT7019123.1 histidine phosphatase family protein [Levilactobacillus namurensis]WNN66271.1 histidine phosphatase family protein [Levilactobacillus namurensis]